jgi:hypothetical protein
VMQKQTGDQVTLEMVIQARQRFPRLNASNSKFDPVILEGIFSAQSGGSNGLSRNERAVADDGKCPD